MFTYYLRTKGNENVEYAVVWGVTGHQRSVNVTAYTTSYSIMIETMHLSCTILEVIASHLSKVTYVNLPHLHLASPMGDQVQISPIFWGQKTRFSKQSCGSVCMILCLAVLTRYQRVTHTYRHMAMAYTTLA